MDNVKAYRGQYLGNGYYMWHRTNGGESYIRKDGKPHPKMKNND